MKDLLAFVALTLVLEGTLTTVSGPEISFANTITLEAGSNGTVRADVLDSHDIKISALGSYTQTVSASVSRQTMYSQPWPPRL